ncbi:/ dnaA / Chromosomal replication initiator of genome is here' protein DnaA / 1:1368 Forward [Candidatus Hepatoplasma crinochetorum]|uniref:Chromosomal replication initiator protein DnaA n=1 Tax=Candidatus Hepatoplasma crinochetorum TaxID=295596 RepID=A0A0G7ZNH7_9MOLU|nr:/ dnaA / Chromosomal replication initiator of genome is here' protein DnaA / 1:1368 Forward [Candidatus Hepatoplasma crinochetorum]
MDVNNLEKTWKEIYSSTSVDEDWRYNFFKLIESSSKLAEIDKINNKIFITVNAIFEKQIINDNFYSFLLDSIKNKLGKQYKLTIITEKEYEELKEKEQEKIKGKTKINNSYDSLNEKFTFDNFIISDRNVLLYKAAMAIALSNNSSNLNWNPFFIHGKSGLGKTHILHSIGNEIKKSFLEKRIKYVEAKDFGNIVMNAFESDDINKNIQNIFNEYSEYDCLLIDDIQFIQSRKKTKEVFFNIFNFFINNNKQIVVTSDQDPKELKDFEERFITRFKGGLTVRIYPPDQKTTEEILKLKIRKNERLDINKFTNESIQWIANNFGENVRFLEGALNRLILYVINSENSEKININFISEVFEDMGIEEKTSFDSIINLVAKKYGINQKDILSKSRKREIIIARNIAIFLTRDILHYSLKDIGKKFNKDHSTIMYAINKIDENLKNNEEFKEIINELKLKI